MERKKLVLIINGRGGCGKDSLIEAVSKVYQVRNESAIDPAKQAARCMGWDGGKEDKDRRFLSDLKALSVAYNDHPTTYLLQKYDRFQTSECDLLFLHIREPEEIRHFLHQIKDTPIPVKTLLVTSPWTERDYGNPSDDRVENFDYDFTFNNVYGEEIAGKMFIQFLENEVYPTI